jgi:galactose-1-phosphate uridylyltransferase
LLIAKSERGICKVICFSPDHSLTIPEMSVEAICQVIRQWMNEYEMLASNSFINYIQIFENKGAIMGCSNPHPHGQIWASVKKFMVGYEMLANPQRDISPEFSAHKLRSLPLIHYSKSGSQEFTFCHS